MRRRATAALTNSAPTITASPVATLASSTSTGAKNARTAGIVVAIVVGLALLALGLGIAVARRHSLLRRPRAKDVGSSPVVYIGNLSKTEGDEKGDLEASHFESTPIEPPSDRKSIASARRQSIVSVYPSTPAPQPSLPAMATPPTPPPQPLLSAARSSFEGSASHSHWTASPLPTAHPEWPASPLATGEPESPITPMTAADERAWQLRLSGAITQAAAIDWTSDDVPPLPARACQCAGRDCWSLTHPV